MSDLKLNIEISSKVNDATTGINKVTKEVEKLNKSAEKTDLFGGLKDQAGDLANNFASSLGPVGSLINDALTTPIGAAGVAVSALAAEMTFLFNESLKGEKLNALNTQFQNLAKSVNISADSLSTRLNKSLDGLADGVGAVQIANQALVTLGKKANELPKLFDLAKKAASGFGGDPLNNLQKFVQAIETGNTRVLRSVGLNIDATKAQKDYARALGSTVDNLSEQGRQQAIINAIYAETDKRYKEISTSLTPLADSSKRFSSALGDLGEQFSKLIAGNYASFFTDIFNSIATGLKKINGNFTTTDRIKELSEEIDKTQTRINQLTFAKFERESGKIFANIDGEGMLTVVNQNLTTSQARLKALNDEYAKLTETTKEAEKELTGSGTSTGNVDSGSLIKIKKTREYYENFVAYLKSNGIGDTLDSTDNTYFSTTAEEFLKVTETVDEFAEKAKQKTAEIEQAFASGLTGGLLDFASGIKSAEDAFNDFARGFLRKITEMILQQFILNAISGSGIGKAAGGAAAGGGGGTAAVTAATGGFITGPGTGTSDSIPARLSNGEFVMKAQAVKNLGVDFLHGLNNVGRGGVHAKTKSGVRAFADGGMVTPSSAPQVVIQNNGTPKDQSGSSFDPTTEVTTIILQDYQKNGPISKAMQGTFGAKRGGFR